VTEVLILLGVVTATAALAAAWRSQDGRVRTVDERLSHDELAAVGATGGQRLLVEFTAPACSTCAATRRVLDDVASARPDVTVRAVDVTDVPDLADAHRVMRAPTTFVVEPDGRIRARLSGTPDAGELAALLDG
jgi:thiol-disulfide isomerase/thioredoxin